MKKFFVLLILFIIAVGIAVGLAVSEQRRRSTSLPVQSEGQQVSSTAVTGGGHAVSSVPAATNEGNITLTITSPQDKTTTADSSVTVTGKTNPGANIMINEYELTAAPDGSFSKSVALDDGENYLSIVAYTVNGDVAERQLMVTKSVSSY